LKRPYLDRFRARAEYPFSNQSHRTRRHLLGAQNRDFAIKDSAAIVRADPQRDYKALALDGHGPRLFHIS
jgi:hypothetical protein